MDEVIGNRPLSQAADALQGTVPGLFVSSDGNAPGKVSHSRFVALIL